MQKATARAVAFYFVGQFWMKASMSLARKPWRREEMAIFAGNKPALIRQLIVDIESPTASTTAESDNTLVGFIR